MKRPAILLVVVAALLGGMLFGQRHDVVGTWQGTLHGDKDSRIVLKVSKADTGGLSGNIYSIDEGGQAMLATSLAVQGSTFKFAVAALHGTYEGKLDTVAGTSITGMWIREGSTPLPLDLTLANDTSAWAIPEPPAPSSPMAAGANPAFEVATIKPAAPDSTGLGVRANGRTFSTRNTTLKYLITFAYDLHADQVSGGPGWLDTEKYDISAIPDTPGKPNVEQVYTMFRKLLADRFKLTFHREKRELSAFVITIARNGPRVTRNENDPNGYPGLGASELGKMSVTNATMSDFAGFLQRRVLDRPVLDQTGISGRYDFVLQFTPDETQYGGRGGQAPPPADGGTAPPDLFNAMQQQLGLRLEAKKTPVDVLVIDHVEKPSDN